MKRALLKLAGFTALFIAFTGVALAWGTTYGGCGTQSTPEPSSLMLLATGGGGLGTWLMVKARRKK